MADRLSQYSMMPNFNQSMLQPHQMQQQNSQQPHQDNHQALPPFSEQSHLWNQMQHLQSQFRPNNGADVNSPQINQQASFVTLDIFRAAVHRWSVYSVEGYTPDS